MTRRDVVPAAGHGQPAQCVGKEPHESAAQAKKVVRNMKRFGKTVVAYRCPLCRGWHVGRPGKAW